MGDHKTYLNTLNRNVFQYLLLITLLSAISCSPTKFLSEEQSLLKKNEIILIDPENAVEKTELKYELSQFYQQKPNRNLFAFFPREYYYFKNSQPGDTSWYNNWLREDVGEVPTIHNDSISMNTAQNMYKYLVNIKGYFESKIDYDVSVINKYSKVNYNIELGPRYKINSIKYLTSDKTILKEIIKLQEETRLLAGSYIDANLFNDEKNKITNHLQNNGYPNFLANYIDVKADSTQAERAFDFYIEILTPPNKDAHQKYKIGKINIYTDFHQDQDTSLLTEILINDKSYFKESKSFIVKPSALEELVFMKPGQLYNRKDRYKTTRRLSGLGTYRFVNISPFYTPENDSIINYNIALSPFNGKWILDYGTDLFYSTLNTTGNNRLFGFSIGGSLQDRNAFGGAEKNILSTELGIEFQISEPININTLTIQISDNIEIPRYVSTLSSLGLLRRLKLLRGNTYQEIQDEASTLIGAGYNFQRIVNIFDISLITASYGYSYQPDNNQKIDFRQIGLNLNQYKLDPSFQPGPVQALSFQNSFFTGFLFRELSFFKRWYSGVFNKNTFTFFGTFETSGLELFGLNKLYNGLANSNSIWRFNDNIDFSNYVKFQFDTRYYRNVTDGSAITSRLFFGMAIPYSDDIAVPYIKQLFVGGPNSIRAWQSRELGPGGYSALLINPIEQQSFFQAGDLRLEFNLEYRFDLFWVVEGALFVDAGNVWTLREDINRPGAQFTSKFYDQIAVAGGWGLRWDFTYFVIRLDFGYKLRNSFKYPDPVQESQWVWDFSGLGNANIAVNYPF